MDTSSISESNAASNDASNDDEDNGSVDLVNMEDNRDENGDFLPRPSGNAEVVFENQDEDEEPRRDIEIYGLAGSSNGRHCAFHPCCGTQVVVEDILRIKRVVIDLSEDLTEEALATVVIKDGVERCTVGFVPRFLVNNPTVLRNIDEHLQVTELYKDSTNTAKIAKNERKTGVAGCIFIREIPHQE